MSDRVVTVFPLLIQFLGLHVHSEGTDHSHSEEVPDYIYKILVLMAGIYCFYLMETIFSIITTHHAPHHHGVSSVYYPGLCLVGPNVAKCLHQETKICDLIGQFQVVPPNFTLFRNVIFFSEPHCSVRLLVQWIHGEKNSHTYICNKLLMKCNASVT